MTAPPSRKSVSLAMAMAVFYGIVCLGFAALGGWNLYQSRQDDLRNANTTLRNLAHTLEFGVTAAFERSDQALLVAVDEVRRWQADPRRDDHELDALLERQLQRVRGLQALIVTDQEGRLRYGTGVDRNGSASVADRPYFQKARDNPSSGLLISEPVRGKLTGRPQLVLARRLPCADGSFCGLVFTPLYLDQFDQLFAGLEVGSGGLITVRNEKSALLARYPAIEGPRGQPGSVAASPELQRIRATGASEMAYVSKSPVDGINRLLFYRRSPEIPVYVLVGRSLDDALAGWHTEAITTLSIIGLLMLLLGGALWKFHRVWQQEQGFRQRMIESFPGTFYLFDANGRFLMWNRNLETVLGLTSDEVARSHPLEFFDAKDQPAVQSAITQAFEQGETTLEAPFRTRDGRFVPYLFNGFRLEVNKRPALIGIGLDISKHKQAEAQINELAFYDQLTHLPNRVLLADRLKQAVAASLRSRNHGALIFIDLDNFKTLNDTQGHDQGDQLLMQVADRIRRGVRDEDTAARLGGDEFVVVLTGLDEDDKLAARATEMVAEKILAALAQPYTLASGSHRSTASIGATLFGTEPVAVDVLMKQADLAMYRAKESGRNVVRFFDPGMEAAVKRRAELEDELRHAITDGQLVLHYQAQVAGEGRITGAEALVRWQHPQRGMVLPAEFIALAEDTDLILSLGNWVLHSACTQLALWAQDPHLDHLTVAVNVSAKQLRQPDFVQQVLAALDSTGAKPGRLKLELTESVLVQDIEPIIEKMFALKAKGISFALDDFGTGYSSLAYLKRLPIDQLKIDRSFVRDVLFDPNDAAIAQTVVALAHSLGLGVIAEGVETQAQQQVLAAFGCHAYQGYLFSRPIEASAFEQRVRVG
ncbi:MAG: EAL domain-containing protein [Rhodoferax sp.]